MFIRPSTRCGSAIAAGCTTFYSAHCPGRWQMSDRVKASRRLRRKWSSRLRNNRPWGCHRADYLLRLPGRPGRQSAARAATAGSLARWVLGMLRRCCSGREMRPSQSSATHLPRFRRWGLPWRSFTVCTSSPRISTGWCWSICTRRTRELPMKG